jgi:hypothetical protein
LSVEDSLLTAHLVLIGATWDLGTWNHEAGPGPILLTSGVEAHLIGLDNDVLECDGFWVTEGDTLWVIEYFYRLLVPANTKRDSYTAHPIAEENILRQRRREAPSKKPRMPRSLNTNHIRNETRPRREVLTFHTAKTVGIRPRYLSS